MIKFWWVISKLKTKELDDEIKIKEWSWYKIISQYNNKHYNDFEILSKYLLQYFLYYLFSHEIRSLNIKSRYELIKYEVNNDINIINWRNRMKKSFEMI